MISTGKAMRHDRGTGDLHEDETEILRTEIGEIQPQISFVRFWFGFGQ
jgi:hypothetical protein